MTADLMQKIIRTASFVYEELTDGYSETDLGREFWKYLRSKVMDDSTKKVKVSGFVLEKVRSFDAKAFNRKYGCRLDTVKKSKEQLEFMCTCVSMLLHHSPYGAKLIDWS